MKWKKARKKPLIVEYREPRPLETYGPHSKKGETVQTGHGTAMAFCGEDLIIADGVFAYPIKIHIFRATYDLINEGLGLEDMHAFSVKLRKR